MIPFDVFRQQAGLIPYQYRHSEFLYGLIRWLRPTSVVEVGTHLGMSAVWMARALQENGGGTLTCIDNFCWADQPDQKRSWFENTSRCGVGDFVRLVEGRSQEVEWPGRVDFAYIDGNHTSKVCRHDTEEARRRGAICVCLNDTATCAGVQKVADDMRVGWRGWDFLEVPFDAGLLVALKREARPAPIQDDVDPWDKA